MKLKSLYINRITTLKVEMSNIEEYVSSRNNVINQYLALIEELLLELKTISNNENIEPHIKYIQLNEKTVEIEKITVKIDELYKDINKKIVYISKEKDILLQNCIEDHTNLSEDDIILEIRNLLL